MAPVTRRSQNAGVAKQVNRKKLVRKESSENWDFVQPVHQNGHLDESDEEAPAFNLTARVDKVTEPLHEMANRVGQEVEAFAIKLDKFLEDLPTRDKYDAAYDLVLEYKAIAQDAVKRLEKDHVRERNQLLRREWREKVDLSVGPGARSVTSELGRVDQIQGVKELRQWQAEVDTWELFRLVLELRSRPEDDERRLRDKEDRLAALGAPNRYTPESKIWERFLLESDVAKERSLILRWLEETANHQESEVSDIVEELEVKAGRGRGLWSHGWMNTREKIKGQKRMGGVLERGVVPPAKIRRSDNGDQLVSTLDPDAASRERATLEKPDTYLDRAFWTVCWEMLRRGKSWHEICDWCEERNEGWRAISLRKASHQASSDLGVAWRRMCRIAATDDCSNPYEAAVYGLLGGDPASSDKVCRTYDDYMYSHYSNNLARQFDQYIMQQLPERIPKALRKHLWSDESLREDFEALVGIAKLLRALRESPKTKDEARQPMKLIQSYLLARETGSFINTLGFAISDAAHANEQVEDTLVRLRDPPARDTEEWLPESGIAEDHDALRISAHMCIILLKIQDEQLTQDERESQDNVIVAYMQFLRKDRKPDLLPLYASCLSTGARAEMSMSRMLQDVGDGPAQRQLIKLMQTYNLNAKEILVQQTNYHLEKFLKKYTALPALRILEDSDDTLYPGQRVRSKYLPEASSKEEEDLVQSLQWWQLLDGDWRVTFGVLARVCLKLLANGHFVCAYRVVQQFPYATVSMNKSQAKLGRSVNVMVDDDLSASPEEAMKRDILRNESRTYFEIAQLIRAIESFEFWRVKELEYTSKFPRPAATPNAVRLAFEAVQEAMSPLLQAPSILQRPFNQREAPQLEKIRSLFIPETVIAYNTVLHSAGHLITRDCLLASMDLSVLIADERSGLAEPFEQAGRVRELVASFAHTSKAMLKLSAVGQPRKERKRDREGKILDMWEIGG